MQLLRPTAFLALPFVCSLSFAQFQWTPMPGALVPVGGDGISALAYDAARARTVHFGWSGTWGWDGAVWTQRYPSAEPPFRRYPAMTYDSQRQRVILLGGYAEGLGSLSDTWEWGPP